MSWKEIIKEDMLEKVILALMPMYGSRKEIIDSNILGVQSEGELYLIPPYTKEDVKSLIEDIRLTPVNHLVLIPTNHQNKMNISTEQE